MVVVVVQLLAQVTGPLKSLSHMLKVNKVVSVKTYLAGKRVDYSGRSVIAVGPSLKSVPMWFTERNGTLNYLNHFVMKELVQREIATNIKNAKSKIERMDDEVWDVLEEAIENILYYLTVHQHFIDLVFQAFEPTLS